MEFKVGDKVKIPTQSTANIGDYKRACDEMVGYELDYLVITDLNTHENPSWEVGLDMDSGKTLFSNAFNFIDIELYEEEFPFKKHILKESTTMKNLLETEFVIENCTLSQRLAIKAYCDEKKIEVYENSFTSDSCKNYPNLRFDKSHFVGTANLNAKIATFSELIQFLDQYQPEPKFKVVSNTSGKYECSKEGEIRNANTKEIIPKSLCSKGYYKVSLYVDGKATSRRVHRLVAEAFINNPENFETVNHIDGNKLNNKVDNLEWCSFELNSLHYNLSNGKYNSSLNKEDILDIYDNYNNYGEQKLAAEKYNISKGTVSLIKSGISFKQFTKKEENEIKLPKIDGNDGLVITHLEKEGKSLKWGCTEISISTIKELIEVGVNHLTIKNCHIVQSEISQIKKFIEHNKL